MRIFIDAVVGLMLVALLAGAVWYKRTDQADRQLRETTRAEVRRFQQQIALQSTLAKVAHTDRGYPESVNPEWFQGVLPANPLLDTMHPWLELADATQKTLLHPPDRVAHDEKSAKFWYNPYLGVVRARVPVQVSDTATLELYNYVNDCNLPDLFANGGQRR
jgi:hypothetical protein